MTRKYEDYFNIDDKYYAAVTERLIEEGRVSWEKFYPHETFVKLLETAYRVLSGAESHPLWVHGAYGTGKSHAVLTLKCLLEAPADEVRAYFADYRLSRDLCEKFLALKQNQKIIVVHRMGSSSIHSDQDLIVAVQESVTRALAAQGIENQGEETLKDAFLAYLGERQANRDYVASLMKDEKYAWDFGGRSLDEVIKELKEGTEAETATLMRAVLHMGEDAGITALRMDAEKMAAWLAEIVRKNHLTVLFIWDEFTEFFQNNPNSLTGFQRLAEVGETDPFYFLIVTHKIDTLFRDASAGRKIIGRFGTPIQIEMPENMAFRLMAQAMKTTDDPALRAEWQELSEELNENLENVREVILASDANRNLGKKARLSAEDLERVMPIHPYAALVLKHISVTFASNQRSMFDFIINDEAEAHAFKYYIRTHGPVDAKKNLLTVDMLWDFFYVQGEKGLESNVRAMLNAYHLLQEDRYTEEERRVYKTILLLQAISLEVGGVELLKPNDRNINLAFDGLEGWPANSAAGRYAETLVRDGVLFKQPASHGRTEYIPAVQGGNLPELKKIREAVEKETRTSTLVVQGKLLDTLSLPAALEKRFTMTPLYGDATFQRELNGIKNAAAEQPNTFQLGVAFAIDDVEADALRKKIYAQAAELPENVLILSAALVPFGSDRREQYLSAQTYARYYLKSDHKQAAGFSEAAEKTLKEWGEMIASGAFELFSREETSGKRCASWEMLKKELFAIDRRKFPYGLEHFALMDSMFKIGPFAQGAECGMTQELKQMFHAANAKMSLDHTVFAGVWHVENYWEDVSKASLPMVKAKLFVEKQIHEAFEKEGRLSLSALFDALRAPKFGYLPNNVTSCVLGFLLKEYAAGNFFWSNGAVSAQMTPEKLKNAIAETLKQANAPKRNFKELYLVKMSPEQTSFLRGTQEIFGITEERCGSLEQARLEIRGQMRQMKFPLWCLKSLLGKGTLKAKEKPLAEVIDGYTGIANHFNTAGASESELAPAVGRLFIEQPALVEEMKKLFDDAHLVAGMKAYLAAYREGRLVKLAGELGDGGDYLEAVRQKFSAQEANWVWAEQTANEKIDDVILDYEIVLASNDLLPRTTKLADAVRAWNKKTNDIRIAYAAMERATGDFDPLLAVLCKMKRQGTLVAQDKAHFLELLSSEGEALRHFMEQQFPVFSSVAKSYLVDGTEEDARAIFAQLEGGHFTQSSTEYFSYVGRQVKIYFENQAKQQLRALWREKTGTASPIDWSAKYQTPILALFSEEELPTMRRLFRVINEPKPERDEVEWALKELKEADFFPRLADKEARDAAFRTRVVGDDAILLPGVDEIRAYLAEHLDKVRPYDWLDAKSVGRQLAAWIDREYKETGCRKVLSFIDQMEAPSLRLYLQNMVSRNPKFGLEILKDNLRKGE